MVMELEICRRRCWYWSKAYFFKTNIKILVFPSGLGYDKSNGKVRTKRVNSIFSCIPEIAKKLKKTKNGKPVKSNQFSAWVTPARFEPATVTFVV